ncbi:hypothetical protein DFH28DRAFT_915818 [Melampsora americana]|nr:hypothetical protein DFH28DRAFT_915818 [Melampsora americana]
MFHTHENQVCSVEEEELSDLWDKPVILNKPSTAAIEENTRTFEIMMNVWQLKPADPDPPVDPKVKRRTRKQGKIFKNKEPKPPQWIKHNGGRPIKAPISISTCKWPKFRKRIFEAYKLLLSNSVDILEAAYQHMGLYIQAFVHRSHMHKLGDKVVIENTKSLQTFLDVVCKTSKTNGIGFKVIHPNPKKNLDLDLEYILQISGPAHSDKSDVPSEEEDRDTDGSEAISPSSKKYKALMEHLGKFFKTGEHVATFPNPVDPGQVLVLNYGRILEWAQDWANEVPGIDEVTPPMNRPGWRYVPVKDYEKEKAIIQGAEAIVDERYAQVAPVINNFYGDQGGLTAFVSNTPKRIRMSPPPIIPSLDEFLLWAEIEDEEDKICKILRKQRVDFRRSLDQDVYTIPFLCSFGMPAALAEDVFKAVPRYINYLKSLKM